MPAVISPIGAWWSISFALLFADVLVEEQCLVLLDLTHAFIVAVLGEDRWDASDGRPLGDPISGPAGELTAIAFSPVAGDLRTAVGGARGEIRIESLDHDTIVEQACEVANRDLPEEWRHCVGDGRPRSCLNR